MKRPALALCAGLLLLGLVPGSALAVPSVINLDQHDEWNSSDFNQLAPTYVTGQVFTVGKTGMLSGVDLYLQGTGSGIDITASIYAVSGGLPTSNSGLPSADVDVQTAGWYHFEFYGPLSVTVGQKYAIVFSLVDGDNLNDASAWYSSGITYTGGAAVRETGSAWGAISGASDFAFRTYVDQVTTNLAWDKTSVQAGATTPLTLTETFTFSNGSEANGYTVALGSDVSEPDLPAWFTLGSITCTFQDGGQTPTPFAGTLCPTTGTFSGTVPQLENGDLATLKIVFVGTAHPTAAAAGTNGVTGGMGCLNYPPVESVVQPNDIGPNCAVGTASVAVVAAASTSTVAPTAAPTPPPTSTQSGSSSETPSAILGVLPLGLVACFGALFLLVKRSRQRTI